MKKLIPSLLITLILFMSCNQNNDGLNSIIGRWEFNRFVRVYSDGTEIEHEFNSCESSGTKTFNEDKTWTEIGYLWDNETCYDLEFSGTWNMQNDKLIFTDEEEDINIIPFYFELSNDTLKIGFKNPNETANEYDDDKSILDYYYSEYIRDK